MPRDFSCEDCEEHFPDYILQALHAEDIAAIAAHLRTCLDCQKKLLIYENLFINIATSPAKYEIPEKVWSNIYRVIENDLPQKSKEPFLEKVASFFLHLPQWIIPLSAAAIAVFTTLYLWILDMQKKSMLLQSQIYHLQEEQQKQRWVSSFLTTPEMQRVLLKGEARASEATGTILIQPQEVYAILIVKNLPPLPLNRVYQLWLIRDKKRENGGVFRVDTSGTAFIILHAPSPLLSYNAFGITEEPDGGSEGPTSPRVLGGRL